MNSSDSPSRAALSHGEIADRARLLWLASGSPVDRDLDFWLEAERSLLAERQLPPDTAPARPARKRKVAADDIDESKLDDRLSDFGEAGRRSVTSAEPQ